MLLLRSFTLNFFKTAPGAANFGIGLRIILILNSQLLIIKAATEPTLIIIISNCALGRRFSFCWIHWLIYSCLMTSIRTTYCRLRTSRQQLKVPIKNLRFLILLKLIQMKLILIWQKPQLLLLFFIQFINIDCFQI